MLASSVCLPIMSAVHQQLGQPRQPRRCWCRRTGSLHPLDFDPDDKWDFAGGFGHYKNANAAAIGAYYRPNEDTMFSIGGSFGGGENMVNAGVSFKLGQGNHVSTSRTMMAKEIESLKAVVKEQNEKLQENENLRAKVDKQDKEIAELKAMVQQLAARR